MKKWLKDRIEFLNENSEKINVYSNECFEAREIFFTGTHLVLVKGNGKMKTSFFEIGDSSADFYLSIGLDKANFSINGIDLMISFELRKETFWSRESLIYLTEVRECTPIKKILES